MRHNAIQDFLAKLMAAEERLMERAMEAALQVLNGQPAKPDPDEKYHTLTELTRCLGYRSPVTLWRMNVQSVAESWAGGRKLYRLSVVKAYLQSQAALDQRNALRNERARAKSGPFPGSAP